MKMHEDTLDAVLCAYLAYYFWYWRWNRNEVFGDVATGCIVNPTLEKGHRRHRHHQWFTSDLGHPKLKEHLAAVIALMRASPNWTAFERSLNRAFPELNKTIPLPFEDA